MNKKQLAALVQGLVLSTQATINAATGSEITEDEARTLVAMKLRQGQRQLIADVAGVTDEQIVIEKAPEKKRAKKTAAKS